MTYLVDAAGISTGLPSGVGIAAGAMGSGWRVVHKFGRNLDIDTAWTDVNIPTGVYTWPQATDTVSLFSDDANDTVAGSGARTVTVEGLDASFDEVSETIDLNGTTTAVGSTQFIRVHRAFVASAGTYSTTTAGGQAGEIDIVHTTGSVPCIVLDEADGLGKGQSEVARYTIPNGNTGYLTRIWLHVDANTSNRVDFLLLQRTAADDVTAPMPARRLVLYFDGVTSSEPVLYEPATPHTFAAKTDIWIAAKASNVNTRASAMFEVILWDGT